MKITVMKFGGTSVADPEKIQRAAERAIAERRKGYAVVVVVSAPGEMTDELIALAERITKTPDDRELDQLRRRASRSASRSSRWPAGPGAFPRSR